MKNKNYLKKFILGTAITSLCLIPTNSLSATRSEIETLVNNTFEHGQLFDDHYLQSTISIKKEEKINDKTTKKLFFVAHFIHSEEPHVYKVSFVSETWKAKEGGQETLHNMVDDKDWPKYKSQKKFLIEQTIIEDGESILTAGKSVPLDGKPDKLFKEFYIKTEESDMVHSKSYKPQLDKQKLFDGYVKEMLEYIKSSEYKSSKKIPDFFDD